MQPGGRNFDRTAAEVGTNFRMPSLSLPRRTVPPERETRNEKRASTPCYNVFLSSKGDRDMATGNPDAEGLPITELLADWRGGSNEALRELLPLVYGRLLEVAQSFMRRQRPSHTLQPTALVGELYVRLASATSPDLKSREHFYSFCARTMRWILTDHARRREAEKRQAHLQLPLTDDIPWLGARPSDTLDLDRALSKLAEIDARAAHIVELRIYLGCTADEAAGILNVSKPTVDRSLTMARAWLCRELRPGEAAPDAIRE